MRDLEKQLDLDTAIPQEARGSPLVPIESRHLPVPVRAEREAAFVARSRSRRSSPRRDWRWRGYKTWQGMRPPVPVGISFENGRIEADEIDMDTKYAGRVAELMVDIGDMVKPGETVARMDTKDIEQSLSKSEAQVRQAQRLVDEAQANLSQLGTIARSMPQLGLLYILIAVPLNILSGNATPLESMPRWLAIMMQASPSTHFVSFAQAILYRGAGLDVVWPQFLMVAAIASLFLILSLLRFRSSLNSASS